MVKRVGNLMSRIADRNNLQEAFLRAARGKSGKQVVIAFRNSLDDNLESIQTHLLNGSFRFGNYHFFTVFDPKRRTICAASFTERVVFHAMMRICHPVFDNYQISESYASRIGRGTYKALDQARQYCRRYRWFAKLDVCKYFDSIDHQVLYAQLCRLFKDKLLLQYFESLLATYETSSGCGLPIGNLTSQYFANHYLAVADHYAKEQLRVKAMVRYMDDVLFFADSKEELMQQVKAYDSFLWQRLHLQVHPYIINKTYHGVPFLGYVVYGDRLRLNSRSRKRFERKLTAMDTAYWMSQYGISDPVSRAGCLFAFSEKADCRLLKKKLYQEGQYS